MNNTNTKIKVKLYLVCQQLEKDEMKGVVNLCCLFLTVVEEVVNEMGTDYSEMETHLHMLKHMVRKTVPQ